MKTFVLKRISVDIVYIIDTDVNISHCGNIIVYIIN